MEQSMICKYSPLVSIIIPAYNASDYLSNAIDSALGQSYQNIEIIVINDGSTDNGRTEEVALGYGDKIRYIKKENGGVSSVLNLAFKEIKGEWFSWLSHDDLYLPQKIEKQINFINQLLIDDPSIDLNRITVRTATSSIDKFGKIIRNPSYADIPTYQENIDVILSNIFNYRLSGCSFLLPYNCIDEIGGFNEKIRTVSDVEYWYKLLFANYKFYCLKNDRLVQNRSHGKQVGKTKVELFNNELNELHIYIADSLNSMSNINKPDVFLQLYKGLVFRNIPKAAKYVKKQYLKQYLSKVNYYLLPITTIRLQLLGLCKNLARKIYRYLKVK